jgi:hypothetical protein
MLFPEACKAWHYALPDTGCQGIPTEIATPSVPPVDKPQHAHEQQQNGKGDRASQKETVRTWLCGTRLGWAAHGQVKSEARPYRTANRASDAQGILKLRSPRL